MVEINSVNKYLYFLLFFVYPPRQVAIAVSSGNEALNLNVPYVSSFLVKAGQILSVIY